MHEPSALSGDGEVLAGETSAEEVNSAGTRDVLNGIDSSRYRCIVSGLPDCSAVPFCQSNVSYVLVDGHSRPPCPEHVAAVRIRLTEERMSKPGPCEAEVEAADAAEEAACTKA